MNDIEPLEPLEAYPIYISPAFDKKEFNQFSQQLIWEYFQKYQQPVTIIKEVEVPKYIEKIVEVPTNDNADNSQIQHTQDKIREAHELLFGISQPQNIFKALNIYLEEAKNNSPQACNVLGKIFFDGKIIPQDIKKCYQYYQKSDQLNNPEGMYQLGVLYEKGIIPKSISKFQTRQEELNTTIMQFEKAAKLNHQDALTDLGFIYENGILNELTKEYYIKPNLQKAEQYYLLGMQQHYPRAYNNLGSYYLNHKMQEEFEGENYQKAHKCFQFAWENGYTKAGFNLGICYEKGLGVFKDNEKAKSLFKEAAMKGDIDSKMFYAYYLLKESTQNQDEDNFFLVQQYLREIISTDPNKAEAYYYLGYLYENGYGVEKELKTAFGYYKKSSVLKYPQALYKLGDMYFNGSQIVQQNQDEAVKCYQEAAEQNYSQAMITLGQIYENGCNAISMDYLKAFDFYKQACTLDNPTAYTYLGLLYEHGKGVMQNEIKAIEYYKIASEKGCSMAKQLLEDKVTLIEKNSIKINDINVQQQRNTNDENILVEKKAVKLSKQQKLPLIDKQIENISSRNPKHQRTPLSEQTNLYQTEDQQQVEKPEQDMKVQNKNKLHLPMQNLREDDNFIYE